MLVAYDISDDRRRDRVAVELQAHGQRVQFSVFLVDGRPASFVRLRARLTSLIDARADSVLIFDMGPRATVQSRIMTTLGRPVRLTGDGDAMIL